MVSHACHREQQIRNRGLGDRCALEPRFGRLSRPGAARWRFPYQPPIPWNLVTSGCAQGRVKAAESVQILLKRGATFPAVRAIAIASHEHNHAQRCCFWLVTKIVLKPQILRNKRRNFVSTCESRLNLTASLPEAADPFCAVDYLPDNNQVDREDDESRQKTDREHYSVLLEIGQCDEGDEKSKKDVAQRNRS